MYWGTSKRTSRVEFLQRTWVISSQTSTTTWAEQMSCCHIFTNNYRIINFFVFQGEKFVTTVHSYLQTNVSYQFHLNLGAYRRCLTTTHQNLHTTHLPRYSCCFYCSFCHAGEISELLMSSIFHLSHNIQFMMHPYRLWSGT